MAKRYRDKAFQRYSEVLSVVQPDLEREGMLASRLYMKNLGPYLPRDPDAKILDLGCGFGLLMDFLSQQGYRNITGVDLCPENTEICREKGLSVVLDDNAGFLEKHHEEFDCITLNYVLEHYMKDDGLGLLELIHSGLRSGGSAIVLVPNMANPITGARSRYMDITHEVAFTEESLEQILLIAGFSKASIYPVDQYCLPNPLLNLFGKLASAFMFATLRLLYLLNGVRSTRIYTKALLGVGKK